MRNSDSGREGVTQFLVSGARFSKDRATPTFAAGPQEETLYMRKEIIADRGVEPKIGSYNTHGTKTTPPSAAKLGVGASTLEQIKLATEARREHSRQLSDPSRRGCPKQAPFG
jgi:hypothetical protein